MQSAMLRASDGSVWRAIGVSQSGCEICRRKAAAIYECVEGKWAGVRVVACPEHAQDAIEKFIAGGEE